MKPVMHVYLYEDGEKFFGEGPCRLLKGIERTGSLRAAALEMDMSYSKAITLISRAEKALHMPLTEKKIGGKGGGGSQLTPESKEFLKRYEKYREACYEANSRIYHEIFSE